MLIIDRRFTVDHCNSRLKKKKKIKKKIIKVWGKKKKKKKEKVFLTQRDSLLPRNQNCALRNVTGDPANRKPR